MSLRVLFMGSDAYAVPAVAALLGSSYRLVSCVTQPDRPQGRGRHPAPCPVKAFALESGVPVLTPEKIGDAFAELSALAPDVTVVAAYGQYIPRNVIALPRLGCINIHPSLLPKYRGAAPMQWAVANGDTETGVTILDVCPRMDAGPILLQERLPIAPEDDLTTLEPRLARMGAELMMEVIRQLDAGTATRRAQDESLVTLARKLEKADARIDWTQPATVLHNRVRGFQPWPGAYCTVQGKRLAIAKTRVEPGPGEPGTLLDAGGDGPLVACGADALRLLTVQPEGKRPMSGGDFLRGTRLASGARVE
ncbi:MAG TPA: methionyl-tRNA formyltransferase [Kiritimatiellia bacterium]|nr:methionyl-tRNA formyltransferase [Kiritimatiellia bacterium]